jgi:hypothetical protein
MDLSIPDKICPECGGKLKLVKCAHPGVFKAGKNTFCTACQQIVDWTD